MISNEFAVKLCLEHEVKRGYKVVKKELIIALRGEIDFVKFIINPEEDDVEPGVIFGRSFLRMTKEITDFGAGTVTIYPELDSFLEDVEEEEKNIRTSWSTGRHLTQEEATKEALVIRISQKFTLLEELRPVLETMAYHDKYKKVLDEIWNDKVELDGMVVKEEEEAIKKVKGEALKEKDDPGAFIFSIRLEGQVNKNTLADTGSDINTMPYRIYEQLGREEMKKVGVTTLNVEFLILDIPIDRDAPIVVGRGFLYIIGGIVNTPERLFSTFDGFCHQTFRAARFDVLRIAESDSDDEEEYEIKRNKFGAPIYGPKPAPYLNFSFLGSLPVPLNTLTGNLITRDVILKKRKQQDNGTIGGNDDEARPSRSKCSRQFETMEEVLLPQVHHEFLLWEGCNRDAKSRIKLREAGSNKEIFTSVAWIRAFNIIEPIYLELFHEFYSTYEFDEVCADDELQTKKIIKFRLCGRGHNLTLLEFA
ncbi:hypothetical protein Tco_1569908 [Tanacetum coccineum]